MLNLKMANRRQILLENFKHSTRIGYKRIPDDITIFKNRIYKGIIKGFKW